MRLDRIHIEDYDPAWPERFEAQRAILDPVLNDVLVRPVEHVGSTSVPGLPAKPIIDMLAVVRDVRVVSDRCPRLADVGWVFAPEPGEEAARKLSFCRPDVARRSHHLHVVESDWGWPDLLIFRDFLRAHPDVAAEYATLKRTLAAADDRDRPRYRAAKAPFIRRILVAAREAAGQS